MLYGSETWALTNENQRKLERTENMMICKLCGGGEGVPVEKIRQKMGIMNIMDVVRLRWLGHVWRREESSWLRSCMDMKIEGRNPKRHSKLTWKQVVRQDPRMMEAKEEKVMDRDYWSYRLDFTRFMVNLGQSRSPWSFHSDAP